MRLKTTVLPELCWGHEQDLFLHVQSHVIDIDWSWLKQKWAGIIPIGVHRTNTDKLSRKTTDMGHDTSLTNHQLPNPTFALPRLVVFLVRCGCRAQWGFIRWSQDSMVSFWTLFSCPVWQRWSPLLQCTLGPFLGVFSRGICKSMGATTHGAAVLAVLQTTNARVVDRCGHHILSWEQICEPSHKMSQYVTRCHQVPMVMHSVPLSTNSLPWPLESSISIAVNGF